MNRPIRAAGSCARAPSGLHSTRAFAVAAFVAAAFLAPAAHAAGPSAISDDARTKFNVGVNLLTDPEGPRYEEAYRAFKAAYAASPSYKILGNLGLCAMKLERDDEAIAAYEKYLADGSKDLTRAEVQQITSDLATLRNAVAHVTIESDPPGAELLDARVPVRGERVLNDYGALAQPTRLGLHQGSHQLTARLEGYPDQTWDVEIVGGQDVPSHKFVFAKEAPAIASQPVPVAATPVAVAPAPRSTGRPVPAGVWIGVAATGLFGVATAVTSVLAMGKHNDFENAVAANDSATAQSNKSAGQTMNIVSDVMWGGTAVAAVLTTVLYFTRPTVETEAAASTGSQRTLAVSPEVGRSGGGLALQGSF
jgi:hypothetical protein